MTFVCILHTLTILVCFMVASSLNSDVKSLIELCPYTDFCTRNATERLLHPVERPCCVPCSCADDCWKPANCCADKQTIIPKQPLESCESVRVKDHNTSDNTLPRYYVTKSCSTADDPLEEKYNGRLRSIIEDFVWVTDSITKK